MPKRTIDHEEWKRDKLTRNVEVRASYLSCALEESNAEFLTTLRYVVGLYETSEVAKNASLSREHLYKALSVNGNPTLNTLTKILLSLELELAIVPRQTPHQEP